MVLLTIVSLFENSDFTLGFGCTTLAVAAIDGEKPPQEKKRLARFLSFIPCSAKLPTLIFICTVILGWTAFGVIFLYVFSIFVGLILGGYKIIKKPRLKKLTLKQLAVVIFKNTLEFLKRITGGVFIAATVLYTLNYFDFLLPICAFLEPLFVPIGLGSAAVIACLVFGLVAKEMIIGAILTFGAANLGLTAASSVSFLLFVLFYTGCVSSIVAMRAKLGTGFAIRTAVLSFAVAYAISFIAYTVLVLF